MFVHVVSVYIDIGNPCATLFIYFPSAVSMTGFICGPPSFGVRVLVISGVAHARDITFTNAIVPIDLPFFSACAFTVLIRLIRFGFPPWSDG